MPVAIFAEEPSAEKKEFKALEGEWKAITMEMGGKPLPKASVPDFTFIVSANGKAVSKSPFGNYQSTITVDPEKSPKTIDNLHDTGAQKGKKQYGIYQLKGDKWTVCMTPPGVSEADRPIDFNTKETSSVVFVFTRDAKAKKP